MANAMIITPDARERMRPILSRPDTIEITAPVIIGCIPDRMSSGAPSLVLTFDLPDGRAAYIETSLKLLLSAADTLKGAYGDPRDEQPRHGDAKD